MDTVREPSLPSVPGRLKRWLFAARIPTLPAALSPVVVGSALAFRDGSFHLLAGLAALWGALWIQIGTNFVNDLYDGLRGVDRPEDRLGPPRAVALGWIPPDTMRRAAWLAFGLATLAGVYLVLRGGIPILVIGVLSILAGWGYTAGPFPLARTPLADLAVLVFFGLVAVGGTYYVHTLTLTPDALLAGVAVGGLITNILVVNNIRDRFSDARAGRKTVPVLLGKRGGLLEYAFFLTLAYGIALHLRAWLAGITLPFALLQFLRLAREEGRALNRVLAGTGATVFFYALTFSLDVAFLR